MTEEENTVCLGSISKRVCEESKDYQPDEIDNENVPPHALKEEHSCALFEETKFDQIPQASEVNSRKIESKKVFRLSIRTWLIFVSLSILTVFVMSTCCLILVFRFRQDTLDTFSVINRSINNMKPSTTDATSAFKSSLRIVEQTHSQDENWKQTLLKIRSQIDEILIQDERQVKNLTVLQDQIYEMRAEGYANLSTINDKIGIQEAEWRQTWSKIKSQINEIEIQDRSQIRNLTALQNQVHEIQVARNTTISTIRDEIQVRKVKWRLYRQNLSEIRSQISKIHVQDQQQIRNLTVLQNQVHEIQVDRNTSMSTIKDEIQDWEVKWRLYRQNFSEIRSQISKIHVEDQQQIGNLTVLQNQIRDAHIETSMNVSTIRNELQNHAEEWRKNLSDIRSHISNIRIQDQSHISNITAIQSQIREMQAEIRTNISTIKEEMRSEEVQQKQNLSAITSRVNEIRIQDQKQDRNLTALQNQMRELISDTNRSVSTIRDKIRGQELECTQNFDRMRSQINEIHVQDQLLISNLTHLQDQIQEIQNETWGNTSGEIHELQNKFNGLERLVLLIIYDQVRLEIARDKTNATMSIIKDDINENRALIVGLNRIVASMQNDADRLNASIQEQMTLLGYLGSSVSPMPSIRLVGGSRSYGRVEVHHNGVWGTICDDSWGINDANVACRMLGYTGANSAYGSARYGQGSGQIWLDQMSCDGTEITLQQCKRNSWGNHDCSHSEDASVLCNT